MPRPKGKVNLDPRDLAKLKECGITNSTIIANRLTTTYPAKVGPSLEIPYRDLDGNVNCYARLRPHDPRTIKGKIVKYESPKGEPNRAYFPAGLNLHLLKDGTSPVFITEGELKALALSQLQLHVPSTEAAGVVGLVGVYGWIKKGTEELIDDLAKIPWTGREVFIVFDCDEKTETRRKTAQAAARLARALKKTGAASVYVVELPPGENGGKQGVDDFLARNSPATFLHFVRQARERGIPSIDLIHSTSQAIDEPELGEAAYHGLIGEFLRFASPLTEATDPCILAHLLPAIGATIGDGPYVYGGDKQPARLNVAVVASTSNGRKGTGLVPVKDLMELVEPDLWTTKWPRKGLSSGEGIAAVLEDKYSDDGNGNLKVEFTEKRLFVVEPEFSKVLAHTRREGNILSQTLRETFDSGHLCTMTVKPREVHGAHVVIVGHITPAELRKRFTAVDQANGFGNRFLWFAVKSDKCLPNSQPLPVGPLKEFAAKLKAALAKARTVGRVGWGVKAKKLWENEYPGLRKSQDDMVGEMTARRSAQVLRIALTYALLDRGSYALRRGSCCILLPHLEAALAVAKYSVQSVEMLFNRKASDSLEDRIYAMLGAGPMMKKDFYRHLHSKAEDVDAALERMERNELVKCDKEPTGGRGRPPEVWSRT
jgi:hypothetical protein